MPISLRQSIGDAKLSISIMVAILAISFGIVALILYFNIQGYNAVFLAVVLLQLYMIIIQTGLWKKQQNIVEAQYEPFITAELIDKRVWVGNGTDNVAFNVKVTRVVDKENKRVEIDGTLVKPIFIDYVGSIRHPKTPVCEFADDIIKLEPTIEITYFNQNKKERYAYISVAKQGECQVETTKKRRKLDP